MTGPDTIQRARDVLKKWRDGSMYEAILSGRTLVPIVDGTAGNPDLLDAIDGLLERGQAADYGERHGPNPADQHIVGYRRATIEVAYYIADAIIAAEERMQS